MQYFIGILLLISMGAVTAAPIEDIRAGTLEFAEGAVYTVETVADNPVQVCDQTTNPCVLEIGKYRWTEAGESGLFWSLNGSASGGNGGDTLTLADVQSMINALQILTETEIRQIAMTVFAENCEVAP